MTALDVYSDFYLPDELKCTDLELPGMSVDRVVFPINSHHERCIEDEARISRKAFAPAHSEKFPRTRAPNATFSIRKLAITDLTLLNYSDFQLTVGLVEVNRGLPNSWEEYMLKSRLSNSGSFRLQRGLHALITEGLMIWNPGWATLRRAGSIAPPNHSFQRHVAMRNYRCRQLDLAFFRISYPVIIC